MGEDDGGPTDEGRSERVDARASAKVLVDGRW
jgi:hypothetical protein